MLQYIYNFFHKISLTNVIFSFYKNLNFFNFKDNSLFKAVLLPLNTDFSIGTPINKNCAHLSPILIKKYKKFLKGKEAKIPTNGFFTSNYNYSTRNNR